MLSAGIQKQQLLRAIPNPLYGLRLGCSVLLQDGGVQSAQNTNRGWHRYHRHPPKPRGSSLELVQDFSAQSHLGASLEDLGPWAGGHSVVPAQGMLLLFPCEEQTTAHCSGQKSSS